MDTTFAKYVEKFNKLYPNIKISYEGITNYQDDMTARLSSSNWGDVCMMPTNILLPDLSMHFHPLCSGHIFLRQYVKGITIMEQLSTKL